MNFRSQTGNLEVPAPLKFATYLGYRTDHPKEAILEDNYWLGSRHMLNPGDIIAVACIRDDATWDKASFEVSSMNDVAVVVEQITEWRHGGAQIIRGLKAVHKGFGRWDVQDERGVVVKTGLGKDEAQRMAGDTVQEEAA